MPLSEFITGGTVKDHTFVELLQVRAQVLVSAVAHSLRQLLVKRDEYRQQYNDHYVASGVDAFVCPPYPGVLRRIAMAVADVSLRLQPTSR
jgi:hypothetical protein